MPDPGTFRDSTEIVVPRDALDGIREEVVERFTVTVLDEGDTARIVGSPVVIKEVSDFLVRNGVQLP